MLSVSPHRIDLWTVFFDEVRDERSWVPFRPLLTADERNQELRFVFRRDGLCYLITRVAVRTILSRYRAIAPEAWRFERTAFGRPYIAAAQNAGDMLVFNVAHTTGLVVIGVTSRLALGVDAEHTRIRPAALDVAESVFSPGEVAALRSLSGRDQHERFFDYWTLKESYIKARGEGLSLPLDRFGFDVTSDGLSFRSELDDHPGRWRFWQVRAGPDHVLAVCAERQPGAAQQLAMRRLLTPDVDEPLSYEVVRESDHAEVFTAGVGK